MTVEDLIIKLQQFPPKAIVSIPVAYGDTEAFEITEVDWLPAGEPAYLNGGLVDKAEERTIVRIKN